VPIHYARSRPRPSHYWGEHVDGNSLWPFGHGPYTRFEPEPGADRRRRRSATRWHLIEASNVGERAVTGRRLRARLGGTDASGEGAEGSVARPAWRAGA
jgi:hypothetical protein